MIFLFLCVISKSFFFPKCVKPYIKHIQKRIFPTAKISKHTTKFKTTQLLLIYYFTTTLQNLWIFVVYFSSDSKTSRFEIFNKNILYYTITKLLSCMIFVVFCLNGFNCTFNNMNSQFFRMVFFLTFFNHCFASEHTNLTVPKIVNSKKWYEQNRFCCFSYISVCFMIFFLSAFHYMYFLIKWNIFVSFSKHHSEK